MGRNKIRKNLVSESARLNNLTYNLYYNRLLEIAVNMFEWINIPDSIDPRFLEIGLAAKGMMVWFYDDVLGYLALNTMIGGYWNQYDIPLNRTAYSTNGYQMPLTSDNSVIIFNNYLHTNILSDIDMYALRLYNAERTIDINVRGQRTPFIIKCTEEQRLTMMNFYMQYDGNVPFIFGDKDFNVEGIQVFPTPAPFVADKLNFVKRQIWNEALTYLGVENNTSDKKERLSTGEITVSLGGVEAQRYCRLNARKQACDMINRMFGLNIDVKYREGFGANLYEEEVEMETVKEDKNE